MHNSFSVCMSASFFRALKHLVGRCYQKIGQQTEKKLNSKGAAIFQAEKKMSGIKYITRKSATITAGTKSRDLPENFPRFFSRMAGRPYRNFQSPI